MMDTSGAHDWEWLDGTVLNYSTGWATGEPNHNAHSDSSFCAVHRAIKDGGKFNDDHCSNSKSYVCSFDLREPL